MSKGKVKHFFELTPAGLLGIELRQDVGDATRILHSLKRYAFSVKKNAIIFTKDNEIIFAKVRKSK
jgi:hypothetical protein